MVTADRQLNEETDKRIADQPDAERERFDSVSRLLDSPMVDALAWGPPARVTGRRQTAILIWGIGYLATGREFLMLAMHRRSIFEAAVAAILIAVGARVVLNSVPSGVAREGRGP